MQMLGLWTLTLRWHSSCKRKSSAGQPAISSPDNRPNSSSNRVSAMLVSQGNSPLVPVPGHHKQNLAVMGDRPVADLQIRELSHSPTPSCSGSRGRVGLSRHSSSNRQRGPPWAAQLESGSVGGGPRNRQGREMFEGSAPGRGLMSLPPLQTHSPANPSSRGKVRSTIPGCRMHL